MEKRNQNSNYRKFDSRDQTQQRIKRTIEEFMDSDYIRLGLDSDEEELCLSYSGVEQFCTDDKFVWNELPEVRTLPLLTDWEAAHESVVAPVCQYDKE